MNKVVLGIKKTESNIRMCNVSIDIDEKNSCHNILCFVKVYFRYAFKYNE